MIKAIVVDDEVRSIDNLCKLITQYCPAVQVQATANNVADAYEKIIILQYLSSTDTQIFQLS